jgi:D-beta-D-heptose 7-phosphate kinase/D-beta-D-heptose 1-phosphate adenosyltransferase
MSNITVFTNGCFDIIHNGHIRLLYEAKKLGDILHVGMNSDASIKRIKGNNRPIMCEDQRFAILSAIKYVDYVHVFDEDTPKRLIEEILPDIIVKGNDWNIIDVVGRHIAKVELVELIDDISTTKIIEKIKKGM